MTVRFLTRFSQRPLHVLGGIGLALFGLGSLGMLYLAVIWLDERNRPIGDRPLLFYSFALLVVGIQLLSLGILAELVTAYNIRAEDTYSIAEKIPAQETRRAPSRDAEVEVSTMKTPNAKPETRPRRTRAVRKGQNGLSPGEDPLGH